MDHSGINVEDHTGISVELAKQDALLTEAHEREIRTMRAGSISQVIIAIGVILGICYLAKLVLVTIFTSILIAFILYPVAQFLTRLKIPQPVAAAIAILLAVALLYGLSYFFYQRALEFIRDVPQYSGEIRKVVGRYQKKAESLRQSTNDALPQSAEDKRAVPVKVQESSGITGIVGRNVGSFTETLLTVTFIPFLVYFMLTWQRHAKKATVKLFGKENRPAVYQTVVKIGEMMHTFIAGNFVMGLFMAVISMVVFGILKLPFFYFIGALSGFLSIVPYLGVVLALFPPIAVALGKVGVPGLLTILGTVLGLHLFSVNVLYPKVIGKRVQLNPLVVTLALLIWGWIWGAMGLILAVPITAAGKIICDNVESLKPFGEWLGD